MADLESEGANSRRVPILAPPTAGRTQPVLLRQWLVSLGEPVSQGERIAELSVPGVLIHVVSPCSGTVLSLAASPLTEVDLSVPLGWIEAVDSD